jgi:hypothetical protein
MMQVEYVDGHVILESGGARVLLDTGAPISVGSVRNWTFEGMPVHLERDYYGVTAEKLSAHIGAGIDVLLGMDFLGEKVFQIDVEAGQFRLLEPTDPLPDGERVPITLMVGVPTIGFHLDGAEIRAFLDTGARLSYLSGDLIAGFDAVATVRDFHPSAGLFETPVRLVPVAFGQTAATLHSGALPPQLDVSLSAVGVRGIVGTDLLEQFIVTFSVPTGQLVLSTPA